MLLGPCETVLMWRCRGIGRIGSVVDAIVHSGCLDVCVVLYLSVAMLVALGVCL